MKLMLATIALIAPCIMSTFAMKDNNVSRVEQVDKCTKDTVSPVRYCDYCHDDGDY